MIETGLPALHEWETFYVITGSSAAALTGLQFVVVALSSERAQASGGAYSAFGTPTVVHFCAVLLVAALLSVPGHTIASLRTCLGAAGLAGLALSGWVVVAARRQHEYAPVLSDWIWHVALPLVAYAAILGAAMALGRRPGASLDVVAAAALLLLFVGIHNAWDSAVWIATGRH